MSQFNKFNCTLKWRMYDNDAVLDNDVEYDSVSSFYKVKQDFDLRFFCWSNFCKYPSLTNVFY
jgi:hypothetical protein